MLNSVLIAAREEDAKVTITRYAIIAGRLFLYIVFFPGGLELSFSLSSVVC